MARVVYGAIKSGIDYRRSAVLNSPPVTVSLSPALAGGDGVSFRRWQRDELRFLAPSFAKLWVAFHELAHCWLHAPGAGFLHGLNVVEVQADIIASCAVLPRSLFEQDQLSYVVEEDYPASLIKLRFDVLTKYEL